MIIQSWHDFTKYPASKGAKYRAQDEDGSVYDYRVEPFIASDKSKRWVKNGNSGYHFTKLGVFPQLDWKNSLILIKHEEQAK